MKQESLILVKQHLLHDLVAFDHLEQIDDVKVPTELSYALVEVKILLTCLAFLQAFVAPQAETSEVVGKRLARIVAELALVQDQMENVEQLLPFWLLANKFAPLLL